MHTIGVPLIAVIVYLARMKNSAKKHTYGRFLYSRKGPLLSFGNNGNSLKTNQYTLDSEWVIIYSDENESQLEVLTAQCIWIMDRINLILVFALVYALYCKKSKEHDYTVYTWTLT